MEIKISIIIPTYCPDSYLYECLKSIEKQTFSKNEYEIIIVLNGCNEPFHSILQAYVEEKMSGFVSIIQVDISGVSNARNVGLKKAKGKYICFVDDDDVLSENYLEELEKKASDRVIVASNVYGFTKDIKHITTDYLTFNDNDRQGLFHNRKYLSNACCKLIPRNIIGDRTFNTKLVKREDAVFMFLISDRIDQIVKTDSECIYYRRLRSSSASRRRYTFTQRTKEVITIQWVCCRIYFSNPFKYNFILFLSRIMSVYKMRPRAIDMVHL